MVKNRTQRLARCARLSPHRRLETERSRARMPARISEEIRARIRELLLAGKYSLEVLETLESDGVKVSRATVDKEAYALQVAGRITVGRKPTKPHRPHKPHAKGAGRPRLPEGQSGKRWSPNRAKVMELYQLSPEMPAREIGLRLGITRQAVERILKDIKSDKSPTEPDSNF